MITNLGGFTNLTEYGALIKKAYMAGLDGKIPDLNSTFFTVQDSKNEHEDTISIGDTEAIGEFTGSLDYDEVQENYRKRITNVEYARGLAIQKKLWLTGQDRVIKRLSEHLGEKTKLRYLADAVALLNNAFNTTYTGGDGLSLCSTAHTSNVGGSNQGNSGTSALSPAAVDATYVLFAKFNTNKDNPMFDKADTLIVPLELEAYANEISGSKGEVDSNNNNINTYYGRFKVISTRMLDDGNNWYMANMAKMKKNQDWYTVMKHEFGQDKDFNTLVLRYYVYFMYGFGFNHWDHIYGHAVS